jgi:hypothetical protein
MKIMRKLSLKQMQKVKGGEDPVIKPKKPQKFKAGSDLADGIL